MSVGVQVKDNRAEVFDINGEKLTKIVMDEHGNDKVVELKNE